MFTLGATGVGQAAVLNQNNTVNGVDDPTTAGSVIQIFASGGGRFSPAGVTGSIEAAANQSVLPVSVNIGGQDATVIYHGTPPGEISGLLQVNAIVPVGFRSNAIPIVIAVGGEKSQAGVTIAVR